jgi:hypothetical protein
MLLLLLAVPVPCAGGIAVAAGTILSCAALAIGKMLLLLVLLLVGCFALLLLLFVLLLLLLVLLLLLCCGIQLFLPARQTPQRTLISMCRQRACIQPYNSQWKGGVKVLTLCQQLCLLCRVCQQAPTDSATDTPHGLKHPIANTPNNPTSRATYLRRSLASATRRSISARLACSWAARSASSASRLALSASFLA